VLTYFAAHRRDFPLRERLDAAMARMRFADADKEITALL
jgi:hypothetical protein